MQVVEEEEGLGGVEEDEGGDGEEGGCQVAAQPGDLYAILEHRCCRCCWNTRFFASNRNTGSSRNTRFFGIASFAILIFLTNYW